MTEQPHDPNQSILVATLNQSMEQLRRDVHVIATRVKVLDEWIRGDMTRPGFAARMASLEAEAEERRKTNRAILNSLRTLVVSVIAGLVLWVIRGA